MDFIENKLKLVKEELGEKVFQQLDLKAKEIAGDYKE